MSEAGDRARKALDEFETAFGELLGTNPTAEAGKPIVGQAVAGLKAMIAMYDATLTPAIPELLE